LPSRVPDLESWPQIVKARSQESTPTAPSWRGEVVCTGPDFEIGKEKKKKSEKKCVPSAPERYPIVTLTHKTS
jgi:hypothetical protein